MDRLDVVGIPAGGWSELGESARTVIAAADVLIGGQRQLRLVGARVDSAEEIAWPRPLRPALPALLESVAGRRTVVLASGDPLVSGIGSTLIEILGSHAVRIHPAVSSVALARARMGWPSETVRVVSVVGRELDLVRRQLGPEQRLIVLSADARTPSQLAALLVNAGYGRSRLTVLSDLGTDSESRYETTAAEDRTRPEPVEGHSENADTESRYETAAAKPAQLNDAADLNVVAVECRPDPSTRVLGSVPGLPDDTYAHDGQLSKRDLRAAALARLAPVPGELLWDLGAGAGSIAIEWARTDPRCRAVAVDRDPQRAARITANAARLGVPGIQILTADIATAVENLAQPDAIFVGGGVSPDLLRRCWDALATGGRLVAHAVTVETEQLLIEAWRAYGGELVRIGVEHLEPLGGFHGWQPARPVVQWSAVREPERPGR